ncbi:complement factor B [Eudromia elegans]
MRALLGALPYGSHALKPGTNPQAALRAVYELLVQQEAAERGRGLRPAPVTSSTRHVIVIMTDGRINMGGSPVPVINQIRELLSVGRDPRNDREDFLDIYAFGLGAAHVETLGTLGTWRRPGQGTERCAGALVSPYFVLTAAHCLRAEDRAPWVSVALGGRQSRAVAALLPHPRFEPGGRRARGVPEFYDFDAALVRLERPVAPAAAAR